MIQVGKTIEVKIPKHSGYLDYYIIEKIDSHDSFGSILLSKIKSIKPKSEDIKFKRMECTSIVEEKWFDSKLTGRQIKFI